jgi:hypothetical protein
MTEEEMDKLTDPKYGAETKAMAADAGLDLCAALSAAAEAARKLPGGTGEEAVNRSLEWQRVFAEHLNRQNREAQERSRGTVDREAP